MKNQVLHTVYYNISGQAEREIRLSEVKGLINFATQIHK